MMSEAATALVTGANRGIGFEVCRQLTARGWRVVLAARSADAAEGSAAALDGEGHSGSVVPVPLDVAAPASVGALPAALSSAGVGRLDALVNNAGGYFDMDQTAATADLAVVEGALATNLLGAWRVTLALLPLLRAGATAAGVARVVNVSSEAGTFASPYGLAGAGFTDTPGMLPAYGVSKAALNALTVKLAAELSAQGVLVNSVCPGFTATQPGTEAMGARPVAEGAAGVVWAATLPAGGPTGGFFRDGTPLAW